MKADPSEGLRANASKATSHTGFARGTASEASTIARAATRFAASTSVKALLAT